MSCRPRRRIAPLLLLTALVAAACAPTTDRPREGARPTAANAVFPRLAPPTLAPPASLLTTPTPGPTTEPLPPTPDPTPSPGPEPVAIASPSTGIYPIVSNVQPRPDSALPPGTIVIGARIIAAGNLVDVVTFVDGDPIPAALGARPGRTVNLSFTRELDLGAHEVRIQMLDERGQSNVYRWQFTVGPRPRLPTLTPAPLLTIAPWIEPGPSATPAPTSGSVIPLFDGRTRP